MLNQNKWLVAIILAIIVTYFVENSKLKLSPIVRRVIIPITLTLIFVMLFDYFTPSEDFEGLTIGSEQQEEEEEEEEEEEQEQEGEEEEQMEKFENKSENGYPCSDVGDKFYNKYEDYAPADFGSKCLVSGDKCHSCSGGTIIP